MFYLNKLLTGNNNGLSNKYSGNYYIKGHQLISN